MRNRPLRVQELQGVITPIITPMDASQEIDFTKLEKLVEDNIAAEVEGILPCGTTGQSATLSHAEHLSVVERVFESVAGRVKVVVSAGSNSTREAISLSTAIEDRIGPSTFLHLTGYYNSPPQRGLIQHFQTLAESLQYKESNIILYNVPSRTTSNMTADTVVKLAEHPQIIGIKEASGDLEQVKSIIERTDSETFRVVSGEDKLLVPMTKMGGFGGIAATANIAPRFFVKMTRIALQAKEHGDFAQAEALQQKINPLIEAVFCAKNPIPLAHMLGTNLRLPLCRLEEIDPKVAEALAQYKPDELGIDWNKYR